VFWDILIAASAAITQVVVTWYGVHVSVKKNRLRNAVVIGIVGGIGVLLTAVATVRGSIVQDALQQKLGLISKQTQLHAIVKVTPKPNDLAMPVPFSEDQPLGLNLQYLNIGNQGARNYKIFSWYYVEYDNPYIAPTVESVWRKFSDYVRYTDKQHGTGDELPFGSPTWDTVEGLPNLLPKNQVDDIHSGKAHIFVCIDPLRRRHGQPCARSLHVDSDSLPIPVRRGTIVGCTRAK